MRNELFEVTSYLSLDCNYDMITRSIRQLINSDVYSYFVGRNEDLITIKVCVSNIDMYNTILQQEAEENIVTSIVNYLLTLSNTKCITFQQPPIELIVPLYQPMIKKMTDKIHTQWRMFEYEDLISIGNLVLVKLYRQGYYLNKKLIWTSFNNEVLLECRKIKKQPTAMSLDDTIKNEIKIDSEELTYGDMIEDESYQEEEEKNDEENLNKFIFEQVKSIVIDKVGMRQWDRLWRDYSKSHTTGTTQQAMRRIRDYFKELGLTRQDFINYYRR